MLTFKKILIFIFTIVRFIMAICAFIFKVLRKLIYYFIIFLRAYFDAWRQIFVYLYTDGWWDLFRFVRFLLFVLTWISVALFWFTVRRLRTLLLFLKDCFVVLPFFFRHPDSFAEYNMLLPRNQNKIQRRRRSIFNGLCFFFFCMVFLLFLDVADEEQFLFMYEFHKWW